jgi:CheY-like chemotaxis protein
VLLVEDNADIRELLQGLLEEMGYAVAAAPDGPDGLALALSNEPDVAIIDIGLPGMSGYEVAKTLRARGANGTRLVALTGYARAEDVRRALEAGFDAHVAKPCDVEQIERHLQ